jgi:AmmeMemoRadiSam system protein A
MTQERQPGAEARIAPAAIAPAPVSEAGRGKLLAWARAAIAAALGVGPELRIGDADLTDDLRAPHGAFVTLKEEGELRGCIGRLDFEVPLWKNVLRSAVSSALEDPRFEPLAAGELPSVRLEISVLEPPVPLPDPAGFDPQVHGIIVELRGRRALLLPKVAQEYGWDARKTLETVCWKAGLPPAAWRDPAARLTVFTAFDFAEERGAGLS